MSTTPFRLWAAATDASASTLIVARCTLLGSQYILRIATVFDRQVEPAAAARAEEVARADDDAAQGALSCQCLQLGLHVDADAALARAGLLRRALVQQRLHRGAGTRSRRARPRPDFECGKTPGLSFLFVYVEGSRTGHAGHSRADAHALRTRNYGCGIHGAVFFRQQARELILC